MSTRLTKQEFFDRLGQAAVAAILTMAKTSVDIEAWVKRLDLVTPEADGTSVDLEDPRTIAGVTAIGAILEQNGIVESGWAESVLGAPASTPPAPPVFARVYQMPWGFLSKDVGEPAPDGFTQSWDIDGLYHQLIEAGAEVSVDDSGRLVISKTVG